MTVETWYDPDKHERPKAVPDYKDVAPTNVEGLYNAYEQRRRERAVKLAHFRYIEDKLQRCYLYHGVHNFQQHCRFLIEEFKQTKDELMGWKENNRVRPSSLMHHCSFNNDSLMIICPGRKSTLRR
jgi:hypothetical protein